MLHIAIKSEGDNILQIFHSVLDAITDVVQLDTHQRVAHLYSNGDYKLYQFVLIPPSSDVDSVLTVRFPRRLSESKIASLYWSFVQYLTEDMVEHRRVSNNYVTSLYSTTLCEESLEAIGMMKYMLRETMDSNALAVLNDKYPQVLPIRSTMVDIACFARDRHMIAGTIDNILASFFDKIVADPKRCHDSIAQMIHLSLAGSIICTDTQRREFYVFCGSWHKDVSQSFIHRYLMYTAQDALLSVRDDGNAEAVNIVLSHLGNKYSRDIIVSILAMCSYSPVFVDMLDTKRDVINLPNGVYECSSGVFRRARPDDYCSMEAGVPYIAEDLWIKSCDMVLYELRKFFNDESVLRFWLLTLAMCLSGNNKEKVIPVWKGKTDSGKSTCQLLVEKVFSEYSGVLPSTMLVGKGVSPHGTTSGISSMKGKRIVFIQEPEESKINSSQLKSLASNDRQYTRQIYDIGRYIDIQALTVIVTNGHLDLTRCDEAALSRLVVIPFDSVFITSRMAHKYAVKPDNVTIFQADVNIAKKLDTIAPYLFYMLTVMYDDYLEHGFHIPDVIREITDEYISHCNPILSFVNEMLMRDPDDEVSTRLVYEIYKGWMRNLYPSTKIDGMQVFIDNLKANGIDIESKGQVIKGYQVSSS
jgi:phage/plasmid-associated DNA primase